MNILHQIHSKDARTFPVSYMRSIVGTLIPERVDWSLVELLQSVFLFLTNIFEAILKCINSVDSTQASCVRQPDKAV